MQSTAYKHLHTHTLTLNDGLYIASDYQIQFQDIGQPESVVEDTCSRSLPLEQLNLKPVVEKQTFKLCIFVGDYKPHNLTCVQVSSDHLAKYCSRNLAV